MSESADECFSRWMQDNFPNIKFNSYTWHCMAAAFSRGAVFKSVQIMRTTIPEQIIVDPAAIAEKLG